MTSSEPLVIPEELKCVPAVKKLMARLARGKPRVVPADKQKETPTCQPTTTAV